jgi:hypothetical protein
MEISLGDYNSVKKKQKCLFIWEFHKINYNEKITSLLLQFHKYMFLLNKVIYHCKAIEYSHDTSNKETGIQKSNMFHKSAILECHVSKNNSEYTKMLLATTPKPFTMNTPCNWSLSTQNTTAHKYVLKEIYIESIQFGTYSSTITKCLSQSVFLMTTAVLSMASKQCS